MGLQRYRHVSSVSFADEGVEREYHPYLSKLNPTCDFKEDFQGSTTYVKRGHNNHKETWTCKLFEFAGRS